jgi:uncharacterized protein YbaA (DUF1428 family)
MEIVVSRPEKYVDSFVMPVPKSKVEAYERFAEKMAVLAKKHGALEYVNCIGDDVKPGKETSYPQAVKLGDDEVVVFSWAVYKSRADRDKANKAIMEDAAFKEMGKNMPVDGRRMFTGGFKVLRGL